jgi:hypothetical protein
LSAGSTCAEAERIESNQTRERVERDIIAYVTSHPGCTQQGVFEAVKGKSSTQKQVFRNLDENGILIRAGRGTKTDPYTYNIAELPVEGLSSEEQMQR